LGDSFKAISDRFNGFAGEYDAFRPEPPAILHQLIPGLLQTGTMELVVDLGSGTGLSTRFWADAAAQVIGIEPNTDMRKHAMSVPTKGNVEYRAGTSERTGLPDHAADVVTCSQSLHWMEPELTFREVARILRPGGVFAAFDYDYPPLTGVWQADAAYLECVKTVAELEQRIPLESRAKGYPKDQHLDRMRASNCFKFVKGMAVHHVSEGNADSLVGLLLSLGLVQSLLKAGFSKEALGINEFMDLAKSVLGDKPRQWFWTSQVRIGIV
jgi:SAM-dependent methyltransferase